MGSGTGRGLGTGVGGAVGTGVNVGTTAGMRPGVGSGAVGKRTEVGGGLDGGGLGMSGVGWAVCVGTKAVGASSGTASCPRQAANTPIIINSKMANTNLFLKGITRGAPSSRRVGNLRQWPRPRYSSQEGACGHSPGRAWDNEQLGMCNL